MTADPRNQLLVDWQSASPRFLQKALKQDSLSSFLPSRTIVIWSWGQWSASFCLLTQRAAWDDDQAPVLSGWDESCGQSYSHHHLFQAYQEMPIVVQTKVGIWCCIALAFSVVPQFIFLIVIDASPPFTSRLQNEKFICLHQLASGIIELLSPSISYANPAGLVRRVHIRRKFLWPHNTNLYSLGYRELILENAWNIWKNILEMWGKLGMSEEMERKHSENAEPVDKTWAGPWWLLFLLCISSLNSAFSQCFSLFPQTSPVFPPHFQNAFCCFSRHLQFPPPALHFQNAFSVLPSISPVLSSAFPQYFFLFSPDIPSFLHWLHIFRMFSRYPQFLPPALHFRMLFFLFTLDISSFHQFHSQGRSNPRTSGWRAKWWRCEEKCGQCKPRSYGHLKWWKTEKGGQKSFGKMSLYFGLKSHGQDKNWRSRNMFIEGVGWCF